MCIVDIDAITISFLLWVLNYLFVFLFVFLRHSQVEVREGQGRIRQASTPALRHQVYQEHAEDREHSRSLRKSSEAQTKGERRTVR